jgi:two-component system, OmpR family, response regulator MtrA
MVIGWIATKAERQLSDAFRAAQWEIKEYSPADFVPEFLFRLSSLDIILIEVLDGSLLDLCREICQARIAPVFALVPDLAYAQAVLEEGVNDFIVVPANPPEAMLRLSNLTRAGSQVRVGKLEIDLSAWRVTSNGQRLQLSPIEFRLLACLARRVGQMVSHVTILEEVWGWEAEHGSVVQVKNYIGRLRRKIEPDLEHPQYIVTIKGEGYRLRNQSQWNENRPPTGD